MLLDYIMFIYKGIDFHFVPFNSEEEKIFQTKTNTFVDAVNSLCDRLTNLQYKTNDPSEEEIMFEVYEAGKEFYDTKVLRNEYFKVLYMVIFRTEDGPRWGTFIRAFGIDPFIVKLQSKMNDPWGIF